MTRSFAFAASLIVCTACGGGSGSALYVSQVTPTPASPDNVFDCSRTTLDSMAYRSISLDQNDRQTTARHSRTDITVADPTFYQAFDAIDVAVNVSASWPDRPRAQGPHVLGVSVQRRSLSDGAARHGFSEGIGRQAGSEVRD